MDPGKLPRCQAPCPQEDYGRFAQQLCHFLSAVFRLHNSLEDRDISDLARKAMPDACAACGVRLGIRLRWESMWPASLVSHTRRSGGAPAGWRMTRPNHFSGVCRFRICLFSDLQAKQFFMVAKAISTTQPTAPISGQLLAQ